MLTSPDYFRVARIVRLRRTNDYADFEHACVFYIMPSLFRAEHNEPLNLCTRRNFSPRVLG